MPYFTSVQQNTDFFSLTEIYSLRPDISDFIVIIVNVIKHIAGRRWRLFCNIIATLLIIGITFKIIMFRWRKEEAAAREEIERKRLKARSRYRRKSDS